MDEATRDKFLEVAQMLTLLQDQVSSMRSRMKGGAGEVPVNLQPFNTRLSAIEMRIGALSMVITRGLSGETVSALEAMIAKVDKLDTRIKELEAPQ